jgi:Uma2 family endonuclease
MTETQTMPSPLTGLTLDEMEWQDIELPPTNLPDGDGDKMESPWHVGSISLVVSSYVAAHEGRREDYFIGANMFLYYSMEQVRNRDFKGPDIFVVKDVDGTRKRNYWAIWEERGRYPDVIIELLSPSTEAYDLGKKKDLYERTFRTAEYFCVAPDVSRILGWRLENRLHYAPIPTNERGRVWSQELGFWLGGWHGMFWGLEHTWLRLYTQDEELVLTPDEAEKQRAEAEKQRAEAEKQRAEAEKQRAEAAEQQLSSAQHRIAQLEAELAQVRGDPPTTT